MAMITASDLTFTYKKAHQPTLKKLNFSIQQGEIFGFLGPSGSGKSTTQKVLYKILSDFEGEVLIDGKPLPQLGKAYFQRIGVGFELPNHYLKLTGKENMDLFASFYPKSQQLPLADLFEQVGLEDSLHKKVEAYSKGMKMRLNFIRAILHNPDIVFFDEPTAGLDPVNAHKIKQLILGLKKEGKTIFITTHNMTSADELCDRVAFIEAGAIQTIDRPESLKRQYGKRLVKVDLDNGESQEFALEDLGHNPAFLAFIQKAHVNKIHTKEASLEEVFIKVTGKSLRT